MKAVILLSGGVDSSTLLHYVMDRYPDIEAHAISFVYGQKHVRELEYAQWQADEFDLPHVVIDLSKIEMESVGASADIPALWSTSALVGEDVEIPLMEDVEGDPQPPTYVPNRNMTLLAVAVGYAEQVGADRVFYGAQQRDLYGYWDCTVEFVEALNTVYRLNPVNPINVEAPFILTPKADVVEIGWALGVDYKHTWSCYKGGEVHCGVCPTCVERKLAFEQAAIDDPTEYAE